MYRRSLALTSRSSADEISHPTFTFYDRRVERSSLPRQHVVLYLLFPPTLYARVEQAEGSRRKAPFYIYAEVQHISSIHYSLWAAFPCSFVMCFLHRGCSRRTDCLLFPFRFSFFPSFSARRRGLCSTRTYSPRKPEYPSFSELRSYVGSRAIVGNSFGTILRP